VPPPNGIQMGVVVAPLLPPRVRVGGGLVAVPEPGSAREKHQLQHKGGDPSLGEASSRADSNPPA
jgi:hypothetical protein